MPTVDSKTFEERLRTRRVDLGLSREQVASLVETSSQTLWRWETGKSYPDVQHLQRLASALDCRIGYFFGEPVLSDGTEPRDVLHSVTMMRERSHLSLEEVVRAALLPVAISSQGKEPTASHPTLPASASTLEPS